MGSVEVGNFMVNGDLTHDNLGPKDSVSRLHDIVHRLEEENEFLLPLRQNERSPSEHLSSNGFVAHDENGENGDFNNPFRLENVPPVNDHEFDEVEFEKDDSWLYATPNKRKVSGTPVKSPDDWLREKVVTPELLRVRGSLTEKLEVIAIENRKGSYERLKKSKEDFRKGSTLSLDWDFEASANEGGNYVKKQNDDLSIGGGSLGQQGDFGSDVDLSLDSHYNIGTVLPRGVQAWAENSMSSDDYAQQSPHDWSEDDDDDFSPMQINLSQSQCKPRGQPAGNMTFKRGQNVAHIRPRTSNNNDQNELTAKPTGAVKPRRSAPPQREMEMQYEDDRAYSSPSPCDFEDMGPVVPRGRRNLDMHTTGGYDDSVSAPVILRGTAKKVNSAGVVLRRAFVEEEDDPPFLDLGSTYDVATFKRNFNNNSASPRTPANIVKPVPRRQAVETPESVRPRGSNVRPRGSAVAKSPSNMESQDASLKVSLSGEGGVVRRRGPVQMAEVAPMPRRSMEPSPRGQSPRRSRDPVAAVRQQEVVPVRRSTGNLPQPRSNDNLPRPRRSFSPSGAARPRGAPPM